MTIASMAKLLDQFGLGFCAFDAQDRTVAWNRAFLRFFPEHDGFIHVGEHYSENLRRFYRLRLAPNECSQLERYVHDGVQRNRVQMQPFVFEHHGRQVKAMSVSSPDGGRLRMWQDVSTHDPILQHAETEPLTRPNPLDPQVLMEQAADGAAILTPDWHIVDTNPQFLALYDLRDRRDATGQDYRTLVQSLWQRPGQSPPSVEIVADLNAAMVDASHFNGAPFDVPLPGSRWIRVVTTRLPDGQLFSMHWDVSDSRTAELSLRMALEQVARSEHRLRGLARDLREETQRAEASERRMTLTFQKSTMPALIASKRSIIVDANEAAGHLFGSTSLRGLLLKQLFGDAAADRLIETDGGPATTHIPSLEVAFRRKDGRLGLCQLFKAGTTTLDSEEEFMVIYIIDLSARAESEKAKDRALDEMRVEATHDPLTGLGNRRQLESVIHHYTQGGSAMLFIDLDGFKSVNDQEGHGYGDLVLRQVADLLADHRRLSDALVRLGGDEFVMLLADVDARGALALGNRLIDVIESIELRESVPPLKLSASIGIRTWRDTPESLAVLLGDADQACYQAKRSGKGCAVVFSN